MRAHVYHDADADLGVLASRRVAVLGYGNQGAAQAQNLRDSGVPVLVGSREEPDAERARADGFEVVPIDQAARRADVVLLLLPDEVQPAVVAEQVAPGLAAGDALVVASGYNVAFGLLPLPDGVDVVMVAPRMVGAALRERFRRGEPYPCLVSVEVDASGGALGVALAVARGIGATAGGAVASSAREEAALDLFSEQAVWPAIFTVLRAAYEVLAEAGFSDDAILDEMYLSGEPAEVFAMEARQGLLEQLAGHSRTSQYGQLRGMLRPGPLEDALRDRFRAVLEGDILSGAFAREWSDPGADGEARIAALRDAATRLPLVTAERAVRAGPD